MIDKLKKILVNFTTPIMLGDVNIMDWSIPTEHILNDLTAHLIANGVRLESKQATSDENKQWIPVSERLPVSEKDPVLIALKWESVDIGWRENERWGSEFVTEYDNGDVTHWMPLPEPPKEEKNNG